MGNRPSKHPMSRQHINVSRLTPTLSLNMCLFQMLLKISSPAYCQRILREDRHLRKFFDTSFSHLIRFLSNFLKVSLHALLLPILFANFRKPKECPKRLPIISRLRTYQEGSSQITTWSRTRNSPLNVRSLKFRYPNHQLPDSERTRPKRTSYSPQLVVDKTFKQLPP